MAAAEFVVTGVVQGVGFRWYARRQATALGLKGWVRNRSDGSVHALAQGDESALARFSAALRQGPPSSVVETVVRTDASHNENYESFEVTG